MLGDIYLAYGLNIKSDFPCPELVRGAGEPHASFRLGAVPVCLPSFSSADSSICQAGPGRCLLNLPGVARYLISDGVEVCVQPAPSADFNAVRLFLLSTCIGALLLQRGMLPLHASSVALNRGAAVFMGLSGLGKSTLAGALHFRGFRLLADDICRVDVNSPPSVIPASPNMMLWGDSAKALGLSPDLLSPVRAGLQKFRIAVPEFTSEPVTIAAIFILSTVNTGEITLSPLRGLQKLMALTRYTFRRTLVDRMDLASGHFAQIGRLASGTRVMSLCRPKTPMCIQELADLVLKDLGE